MISIRPLLALDLGSYVTRMLTAANAPVTEDFSVVAYETRTGLAREVGRDALRLGAEPGYTTIWPIDNGTVEAYSATVDMLRIFHRKHIRRRLRIRPDVLVSIPKGASEVAKRAAHDVTLEAIGANVTLIDDLLASTLGAGVTPDSDKRPMLLHIGAGHATIGLFKDGGISRSCGLPVGGKRIDALIQRHLEDNHDFAVDLQVARDIKHTIGSLRDAPTGEWRGSLVDTGFQAHELHLSGAEIQRVVLTALAPVADEFRRFLKKMPADEWPAGTSNEILMCGGCALLPGIDEWLSVQLGARVTVLRNSEITAIHGLSSVLSTLRGKKWTGRPHPPWEA